jgi:hypothetical protein
MPISFYNQVLYIPAVDNYNEYDYIRTADMAYAYGITPDSQNRIYMSWQGIAHKGTPLTHYNEFLSTLWNKLGSWVTFREAFFDAAHADSGSYIVGQNFSYVGDLNSRLVYSGE